MHISQSHNNRPKFVSSETESNEWDLSYFVAEIKAGNQSLPFEIAPKETENALSWEEARLYCQFLNHNGGGWRLPNKDELNLMHKNKTDDMKYEKDYYWSSTVYDDTHSWAKLFPGGFQFDDCNTECNYVRAIRDKI